MPAKVASGISYQASLTASATIYPSSLAGRFILPCRGKIITNVVPCPGRLSTSIRPPWLVTIRQHFESPSPRPRPACRAEKKGSKIWRRCSGVMPGPLSVHANHHFGADRPEDRFQCVRRAPGLPANSDKGPESPRPIARHRPRFPAGRHCPCRLNTVSCPAAAV